MTAKNALTVSLTSELSAFVHAQVASGRYHTASEVVRAGLRLLTRCDPVTAVLETAEAPALIPDPERG